MKMKKIIALALSAFMLLSLCAIPAFAEEEAAFDPFAGDYAVGEMPPNMFSDPAGANNVAATNAPNTIQKGSCTDYASYYHTAKVDLVADGSGFRRGLAGVQLLANNPASGFPSGTKLISGQAYVFMIDVINYGNTDSFTFNSVLSTGTNDEYPAGAYPIEHGSAGFTISDKVNWTTYKATMKMPGSIAGGEYAPYFTYGFQNAAAGSSVRINYKRSGLNHPYFAAEEAYDITLEAKSGDTVIKGVPAQFEANLLNQIGTEGYLDQNVFTFSVFGADGNAVNGLNVTNTGAVATVSATDDVADGTYYVRASAKIDEETTWQKTIAFDVVGAIPNTDDHVKEELNDNIVDPNSPLKGQTAGAVGWTSQNLPSDVTHDKGNQYYTTFKCTSAYENNDYWGVGGSFMQDKNTSATFVPEENTTYVFETTVRSLSGEQYLNLVYTSGWNLTKTRYSNEYGAEGKKIGTEWETFKATVTTSTTSASANGLLLGLRKTPENDYLIMNHTLGFYCAKEKAHDIRVTGATNTVFQGETLNLEAEVLNQIETQGTLTQSFDWVAVDTDRMNYVNGITFVPTDDGANVTVNVADTVAPGNYIIVAQNETYGMNRQFPITVTAPTYAVTERTLVTTANSATLNALTVTSDRAVMVIVAAFSGDRMVDAIDKVLRPVEGENVVTLDAPLALTGLSAGNEVRVFVWYEDLTPFTMQNAWKQPVVLTE